MITEFLINSYCFVINGFISLLPTVNFTFPSNLLSTISDLVVGIGYVLPIPALMPIFFISISITMFKVVLAIIVRVKSFIPTMGA